MRDVWIRTQSAAVASWRATDLATHPSKKKKLKYAGKKIMKMVTPMTQTRKTKQCKCKKKNSDCSTFVKLGVCSAVYLDPQNEKSVPDPDRHQNDTDTHIDLYLEWMRFCRVVYEI